MFFTTTYKRGGNLVCHISPLLGSRPTISFHKIKKYVTHILSQCRHWLGECENVKYIRPYPYDNGSWSKLRNTIIRSIQKLQMYIVT